ncbi:unnamed protein product [Cylicostephanus goldi]|uniref:Glycosyl-hydrolase family 116 catalytic region domain-containing protein n=1 Tax=Cylicostephanus goldi TaxID=71465 RepID=A0A3P6S4V1_CYLGO|nr:unnamed protein product [Cylicostephanus goldi]
MEAVPSSGSACFQHVRSRIWFSLPVYPLRERPTIAEEEPWAEINGYLVHDSANWRDLNLKFVILCWRDYKLIVDKYYDKEDVSKLRSRLKLYICIKARKVLDYFYKLSEVVIRNALKEWDPNHDGMIENSGTPDQTYDAWTMTGASRLSCSAYCGSLWLAAVYSTICMADELGKKSTMHKLKYLEETLEKAKVAYVIKLWNGRFFNFDESASNQGLIMADQIGGLWCLTMLQENEIIREDNVSTSY